MDKKRPQNQSQQYNIPQTNVVAESVLEVKVPGITCEFVKDGKEKTF